MSTCLSSVFLKELWRIVKNSFVTWSFTLKAFRLQEVRVIFLIASGWRITTTSLTQYRVVWSSEPPYKQPLSAQTRQTEETVSLEFGRGLIRETSSRDINYYKDFWTQVCSLIPGTPVLSEVMQSSSVGGRLSFGVSLVSSPVTNSLERNQSIATELIKFH